MRNWEVLCKINKKLESFKTQIAMTKSISYGIGVCHLFLHLDNLPCCTTVLLSLKDGFSDAFATSLENALQLWKTF